MKNPSVAAKLQGVGFTEYEARAYLALLGAPDANGYEVAKASAIPRANIYPVLERLVVRHAAQRMETPAGTRYAAVAPGVLLARLEHEQRSNLAAAHKALTELAPAASEAPVFSLRGHEEALDRARETIRAAHTTLLVALQPPEAAALAADLAQSRARGAAITTLCMECCARACGGCTGEIHRLHLAPGCCDTRWLVAVADDRVLAAAELRPGATRGIGTEQPLIVALAAAYIRQSIALAAIGGALGERFEGLLSEKARKVLDGLHPDEGFLAWLCRMNGQKAA